jgi:four helix bundle protein
MDREPARRFEDLVVWQKAHAVAIRVYRLTTRFPKSEGFGLVAQMRRAAVSVPANIAEAFSKRTHADKARVLNISQCSLEELRYYFILSRDLEYLEKDERWPDIDEVARLLGSCTRAILKDSSS